MIRGSGVCGCRRGLCRRSSGLFNLCCARSTRSLGLSLQRLLNLRECINCTLVIGLLGDAYRQVLKSRDIFLAQTGIVCDIIGCTAGRIVGCGIIGCVVGRIVGRVIAHHIIDDLGNLLVGDGIILFKGSVDDLHLHVIDNLLGLLLPDRLAKFIRCCELLHCRFLLGGIQRYAGKILIGHQSTCQGACSGNLERSCRENFAVFHTCRRKIGGNHIRSDVSQIRGLDLDAARRHRPDQRAADRPVTDNITAHISAQMPPLVIVCDNNCRVALTGYIKISQDHVLLLFCKIRADGNDHHRICHCSHGDGKSHGRQNQNSAEQYAE